jgi:hypothetical protein
MITTINMSDDNLDGDYVEVDREFIKINPRLCEPVELLNSRINKLFLFGDISDRDVCLAYKEYHKRMEKQGYEKPYYPYEFLSKHTGKNEVACFKACERAERRGFIEYGVSLRTGWLTEKGEELIK